MSKDKSLDSQLLHFLEERHHKNFERLRELHLEIQYLKALAEAIQMLDSPHPFIQVLVPLSNYTAVVASENDPIEPEPTKDILFTFEKYYSRLYLSSFTITD